MRVKRSTLASVRDGGRLYVLLETEPTTEPERPHNRVNDRTSELIATTRTVECRTSDTRREPPPSSRGAGEDPTSARTPRGPRSRDPGPPPYRHQPRPSGGRTEALVAVLALDPGPVRAGRQPENGGFCGVLCEQRSDVYALADVCLRGVPRSSRLQVRRRRRRSGPPACQEFTLATRRRLPW